MANQVPYRIQTGVLTVYKAPVGEADPGVDTGTPAGNWVEWGETDGELIITPGVTKERLYDNTSLAPQKVNTTAVEAAIAFTLADMELEQIAKAFSDATVTDVAAGSGTKGYRHFTVPSSPDDDQFAILLQNSTISPYMSDLFRILVYRCAVMEIGDYGPFGKEGKVMVPVTLAVLDDSSTPGSLWKVMAVDAAAA